MFLKLTDNDSTMDVYVNCNHIVRFVANGAGEGTILFLTEDAAVAPKGEPQVISVHENSEEIFRLISKMEKPAKPGTGSRGLI